MHAIWTQSGSSGGSRAAEAAPPTASASTSDDTALGAWSLEEVIDVGGCLEAWTGALGAEHEAAWSWAKSKAVRLAAILGENPSPLEFVSFISYASGLRVRAGARVSCFRAEDRVLWLRASESKFRFHILGFRVSLKSPAGEDGVAQAPLLRFVRTTLGLYRTPALLVVSPLEHDASATRLFVAAIPLRCRSREILIDDALAACSYSYSYIAKQATA